jgi:HlyD family secretion protein
MPRVLIAVLVVVAVAASVIFGGRWWAARERAASAIRGSGIIEVTQVDVAFEVAGRMIERSVDEGAMVDKGEPVGRLDNREYQLRVDRAVAVKASADARYRMMTKGAREQEVGRALAAREAAEAELAMQTREHARITRLFAEGIVSQGERDRLENLLASARAARDQAAAQLDQLREGFRIEEIEGARAEMQRAAADLELAELDLARCQLFAPAAGRVLSKSREPGEMVQPGTPIVTLGDLSRPWVNVYVGERDLGKVHVGMAASVTVDSFPDQPFNGKVTFIAERAEFTPKNIQTPDERVKLVYRVKVEVETRDEALKPGMPADTVLPLEQPITAAKAAS